jgi:glycine cleavage system pyridoxal-binding protein P
MKTRVSGKRAGKINCRNEATLAVIEAVFGQFFGKSSISTVAVRMLSMCSSLCFSLILEVFCPSKIFPAATVQKNFNSVLVLVTIAVTV